MTARGSMGRRSRAACAKCVAQVLRVLGLVRPEPPLAWLEKHVHLDLVHPDVAPGAAFAPDPYQIEPILAQLTPGVREVVCMAVEQTGKTLVWVAARLYQMVHDPAPAWVVYPSDEDAAEKNMEMVEPLMRGIPRLSAELDRPNSKRTSPPARYCLSDQTMYFGGSGVAVISKTIKYGIADEVDHWVQFVSDEQIVRKHDNLLNLRKRLRSVADGRLTIVCSPTTTTGPVSRAFEASSQGVWHLRCLGCGKTHPSHDLLPLRWDKDAANVPVEASIRWVCPYCQRPHLESEAPEMNQKGEYVHALPEKRGRVPGYQWGALACPRAPGLCWAHLAQAIVDAGRTGTRELLAYVDNSLRGLPYRERHANTALVQGVLRRCQPRPEPGKLALLLFAADTQDDGWYWVVRGYDQTSSSWRLAAGMAKTEGELLAAWDARYRGARCAVGVIDEGGHRAKVVQDLVAKHAGLYSYKGEPQAVPRGKGRHFAFDAAARRLFARPLHYQAELLHHVHHQDLGATGRQWWLPPEAELEPEYIEHLCAVRRDPKKADTSLELWVAAGRADHWFDCEKQVLVLWDFVTAPDTALARGFWRLPMPWHAAENVARPAAPEMEG